MALERSEDSTRGRIMDAAFACAERFGIGRTTMADVARAAGLSRQTLYRNFSSKHDLTAALVLREEERLLAEVRSAIVAHADLRPALEAALLACLGFFRNHPLLTRVMAEEPQELLPFLTVEGDPVIRLAAHSMEGVLAERLPAASPLLVHRAAEACARLLTSYAMAPPRDPDEEVAANLAELLCNGLAKEAR